MGKQQRRQQEKGSGLGVPILALTRTCYVTLGKSPPLSEPWSPGCAGQDCIRARVTILAQQAKCYCQALSAKLRWWLSWERICLQCRRPRFDPWVGKISWRREWQPTPVFLPGEPHGQRSQAGYSPRGCRVRHDCVTNFHFSLSKAEVLATLGLRFHRTTKMG